MAVLNFSYLSTNGIRRFSVEARGTMGEVGDKILKDNPDLAELAKNILWALDKDGERISLEETEDVSSVYAKGYSNCLMLRTKSAWHASLKKPLLDVSTGVAPKESAQELQECGGGDAQELEECGGDDVLEECGGGDAQKLQECSGGDAQELQECDGGDDGGNDLIDLSVELDTLMEPEEHSTPKEDKDHCSTGLPTEAEPEDHGVACDQCKRQISGTRYRCYVCANYDLCEGCESKSLETHGADHPFIKLRTRRQADAIDLKADPLDFSLIDWMSSKSE